MGRDLLVCVAQDTCKGKSIEEPRLVKKWLELCDSKTEHLPGRLPLVPGMPVIVTQNIPIELGLINGMTGIFRQLVYEEDSESADLTSDRFPSSARYIRKPFCDLVEVVRSKIPCNFANSNWTSFRYRSWTKHVGWKSLIFCPKIGDRNDVLCHWCLLTLLQHTKPKLKREIMFS